MKHKIYVISLSTIQITAGIVASFALYRYILDSKPLINILIVSASGLLGFYLGIRGLWELAKNKQ